MIRPIIALIGLPPLIILAGLVYSTAFIRSSHYGAYFVFCIVYGFLCYLLFLLSRCIRSSALLWVPVLIAAWIGPVILGHYYGYTHTKYIVWRMVKNDTDGTFDRSWKNMNRDRLFDRYVESVTGNSIGGFPAYLSLMAYEGWSGLERAGGAGAIHIERKGIWVWIAWFMHFVFLLITTACAMGATIRDEDLGGADPQTEKKRKTVPTTPAPSKKQQPRKYSESSGETIRSIVMPENKSDHNGWWLIRVSFKGSTAVFRAYYPESKPTGRSFFMDIHHALYRLKSKGALAALAVLGSVEGGLTAQEALDKLMEDDKKIHYLLGSYYYLFENDDKFFPVFFGKDTGKSTKTKLLS